MNAKSLFIGASLLFIAPGLASAQSNDDCSGATPIAGYNTFSFDNSSATASGVNDCNGLPVRKDLWYEWTAPSTNFVRFETCGTNTNFETRIAVYTANSSCGSLTLIDCAAANCGANGLSRLAFSAVQGQSYLMRVGSRQVGAGNNGPGQFVISADPCDPAQDDQLEDNDDCASAVALPDGTYSNLWCSKLDPDWYSFCVDAGGTMSIDVLFSTAVGDVDIFAFDGCGGVSLGVGGSPQWERLRGIIEGGGQIGVCIHPQIKPKTAARVAGEIHDPALEDGGVGNADMIALWGNQNRRTRGQPGHGALIAADVNKVIWPKRLAQAEQD